jgi:hypothetical protein
MNTLVLATEFAEGPKTGGWIVGLILIALIIIGTPVFVVGFIVEDMPGSALGSLIVGLLCAGFWLWGSWPLAYEYHHWIPTEGTVVKVDKRIVSTGSEGGISEKYVLKFSDGRVRALNDTIGGTLGEGDKATLKCKKAYDFGVSRESHGWDCKWAGPRL